MASIRFVRALALLCLPTLLTACAADSSGPGSSTDGFVKAGNGKYDASVESVVLNFEFDGEFVTDYSWDPGREIQSQLLYSIGHLNADRSVGRLDRMILSDVKTSREGALTKISYHAVLPVAWGKKNAIPAEYTFKLPRDIRESNIDMLVEKYGVTCTDSHAHDVDAGSFWYYYRPNRSGCGLAESDLFTTVATVSVSTINTTGKYPEYHKVWEDDALKVVAIFGKYEDGATTSSDAGIANYNNLVAGIQARFSGMDLVTVPEVVPASPGIATPDITFTATLPEGRTVNIVTLLVDNVREAGPEFDARYRELSERADLIIYNGHAGLGSNVRAMARKGSWVQGQYVIVFQNGCDTYAYIDNALDDAHAAVNPDDETGTKYIDTVVNAMPSYFHQGRRGSLAFINALVDYAAPKTFEQIFAGVDPMQVVLVTGEADNVYVPGYGENEEPVVPANWGGLDAGATVALDAMDRYETPVLEAGSYTFTITGSGDADLYVRVGAAPDLENWDCRPYRNGSSESCTVTLGSPTAVHVMVHGYEANSSYTLVGDRTRDDN